MSPSLRLPLPPLCAGVIDRVYKDFTTSPQHPMGGTATLTLLNDADPFDAEGGGVRYSFQPPGKTFMEPGGQSGEWAGGQAAPAVC